MSEDRMSGMAMRVTRTGAALALLMAQAACDVMPARTAPAVPPAAMAEAVVPGYSHIRYVPGVGGTAGDDELARAVTERLSSGRPIDLLALSGGADGGAFGAGVMKGWTERGDRPEFDYVTGVSTGALIAPLAFLGPRYDEALGTFYTQTRASDVLLLKPLQVLAGAPAIGDSSPLRDRIRQIVTPQLVADIAAERRKGRLLLIGTTNIESQRQVIWDIGRIAASNQPDRVDLIRDILLASASIPAAFPPVAIDVVADGQRFQELHVDGGVTRGVFAYPDSLRMPRKAGPRRMWVIRNSKLAPEPEVVPQHALAIASRSLSTMIKTQSLNDIGTIRRLAQRDGFQFHVTAVPPNLAVNATLPFDPVYMQTVYRAGLATGRSAHGWASEPGPLLAVDTTAAAAAAASARN